MANGKSVGVFIDGLNVRHRLRELRWPDPYDVGYMATSLAGPRKLVDSCFYHPAPVLQHLGSKRYATERAYLDKVGKDVCVSLVRGGYMVKRDGVWIEKQTDVYLATHLVFMAATKQIDVAVLVSADADLVPAVKRCQELGVAVELVRFKGAKPKLYELEATAAVLRRAHRGYFRPYS
jgi:uncharacterized LabA/DUF88 family protein